MKYLLLAAMNLFVAGCAQVGIAQNNMQPDGTYRVVASGNCYASKSDVETQAQNEASNLCNGHFTTKSSGYYSQGCFPFFRLIVKCDQT